jgi:hypothetical protein
MPAAYNFGDNAKSSASVQDVRSPDRHYREGYVAARVSAGRSVVELNLAPKAALQLARELRRAALQALNTAMEPCR